MKFTDQKEFQYDPVLFRFAETQTALKVYAEYVQKYTPRPAPKTLEVERSTDQIDPVWHVPLSSRTQFSRELLIPVIVHTSKQKWVFDPNTKVLIPKRTNQVIMAFLHLQKLDYFPQKGDFIIYSGYRNIIIEVEVPPEAYWQQTNCWMGLTCHTEIAIEGDAKPVVNPGQAKGPEKSEGVVAAIKSAE